MPDSTTTNYGFTKPEVGGSNGSWGGKVNGSLDDIDTEIKAREDEITALEADVTELQEITDLGSEQAVVAGGSSSARTATIDLDTGSIFNLGTVSFADPSGHAPLTLTFTNRPAKSRLVYILIDPSGSDARVQSHSSSSAWAKLLNGQNEQDADNDDGTVCVPFLIRGSA